MTHPERIPEFPEPAVEPMTAATAALDVVLLTASALVSIATLYAAFELVKAAL